MKNFYPRHSNEGKGIFDREQFWISERRLIRKPQKICVLTCSERVTVYFYVDPKCHVLFVSGLQVRETGHPIGPREFLTLSTFSTHSLRHVARGKNGRKINIWDKAKNDTNVSMSERHVNKFPGTTDSRLFIFFTTINSKCYVSPGSSAGSFFFKAVDRPAP